MLPQTKKSAAWDILGKRYWEEGYNGGPKGEDLNKYINGIEAGSTVCVLGASTIVLVEELATIDVEVVVVDFSTKMLLDLNESIKTKRRPAMVMCDITSDIPADLHGSFDYVLADRLINRFDANEAQPGANGMIRLLKNKGVLRTMIRLGIYERDIPLMSAAMKAGVLYELYNPATLEIDYSTLPLDLLEHGLEKHGRIDMAAICNFYSMRGAEKRFTRADVLQIFENSEKNGRVKLIESFQSNNNAQDELFFFQRSEY